MKGDHQESVPASNELQRLRRRVAELELFEAEHLKLDEALRASEEKYRTLVENINVGIYRNTGGPDGKFIQANPAVVKMFGYDSVEEFMKVPVSALYQYPSARKAFIEEAIRNGFLKDKEIRLKKKDGTHIVGACTSKVQYDEKGDIKWIDGVIEDVTERKLAEERIEKSSYYEHTISSILKVALESISLDEKLIRILDLILEIPFLCPDARGLIYLVEDDPGMLVMKAQHGFTEMQLRDIVKVPVGCNLCGRAASKCEITFSGDVRAESEAQSGPFPHGQYCIPVSSGDHMYGVLSLVLREGHQRDDQEEKFLTSVANTLAGMIEHKSTELEKEKLQSQLIQSEKLSALGRITANVAHEIRNPVTVLGGVAKRLARMKTTEAKGKEYLDIIISEALRLEKILNSVLSFTREEHIHKEQLDLNDIIKESVRIMEVLYKGKSIAIETELYELAQAPVDKDQVREVLDNLISNAAESINEAGGITIKTGSQHVGGKEFITLSVTDTGKGMSKDELNKVFEPFFTTKAVGSGGGIGLGLSICKKIMDGHGGQIKVESHVGVGSIFTLYFPRNNKITTG